MNYATMNKQQLRQACRDAKISYGKLNNDGMRSALASRNAPLNPIQAIGAALEALGPLGPRDRKIVTVGVKHEKNRDESNGIKRPSIGGVTRRVWDAADNLLDALQRPPTRNEIMQTMIAQGVNRHTTSTQYAAWRKFMGFVGNGQ